MADSPNEEHPVFCGMSSSIPRVSLAIRYALLAISSVPHEIRATAFFCRLTFSTAC
jgi:hypothetical protein